MRYLRTPRNGFVDPIYMILLALVGTGVALLVPGLRQLFQGDPISAWHWAGLGAGALMIGGCVVWYVRMK